MSIKIYRNLIYENFLNHIRSFSFSSKNSKIAAKSAIACVLSVTVAYSLEFNMVLYAGMSSLIMSEANMGATIKKGFMRAFGTLTGYAISILFYGLFIQNHFTYTIVVLVVAAICYYKYACSEYSYFWLLIIVTFVIISVDSIHLSDSTEIIYIAFNRLSNVLVGIVVTFLVHIYFWPIYATSSLVISHAKMRKAAFKAAKRILYFYFYNERADKEEISVLIRDFSQKFKKYKAHIETAHIEKKNFKQQTAKLHAESIRLNEMVENFIAFYRSYSKHYPVTFQLKFKKIYERYEDELTTLYKKIINHKKLDFTELTIKREMLFKLYQTRYKKEVRLGHNRSYTVSDVFLVNEAFLLIDQIFELYFRLFSVEQFFNETQKGSQQLKQSSLLKTIRIFGQSLTINIPAMKYGIRTAVCIVFTIWLWWTLEFPEGKGGVNIVLAIVTISNPDLITTNIKSLQRLIGCCIGAGLGLLFLALQTTVTPVFLICLFVATYFGAYVKTGNKYVSYIGLQISLGYIVTTVTDYSQVTNVEHISFRIVGIIMGIIVAWGLSKFIFPENYLYRLRVQIKDYLHNIRNLSVRKENQIDKAYEINELKSIKFLGDSLYEADKLTNPEHVALDNWYLLNRRLIYVIHEMESADNSVVEFITKLKPQILDEVIELLHNFGNIDSVKYQEFITDMNRCNNEIEDLKISIRKYNLTVNIPYQIKQKQFHIILSLKRLVARLKDLHILHNENRNIFSSLQSNLSIDHCLKKV